MLPSAYDVKRICVPLEKIGGYELWLELGYNDGYEEEDGGGEAVHGEVQAVAFDLADEGEGDDGFGHAVEEGGVVRDVQGFEVGGVVFGEDVGAGVANGVADPVVGLLVADEELGSGRGADGAVRDDGREDDAHGGHDGAAHDDDEDREEEVADERDGGGVLECDGDHAGEEGDAEGGFGVEETDGVLGVVDGPVEEVKAVVEVGCHVLALFFDGR